MIKGQLFSDSALRVIFPEGVLPLATPNCSRAVLGDERRWQDVYMLALRQCTAEQLEALAQSMSAMGQGTIAAAREHLASADELPIRAFHIRNIKIPLAAFL